METAPKTELPEYVRSLGFKPTGRMYHSRCLILYLSSVTIDEVRTPLPILREMPQ